MLVCVPDLLECGYSEPLLEAWNPQGQDEGRGLRTRRKYSRISSTILKRSPLYLQQTDAGTEALIEGAEGTARAQDFTVTNTGSLLFK